MAQPWREHQGLWHRGQPQFVNKLRSFKIDFSDDQQFEKLGPTNPPRHKLIEKSRGMGAWYMFQDWEVQRREKQKGSDQQGKTTSHLPARRITIDHLAIPGPSCVFSLFYLLQKFIVSHKIVSYRVISPRQDWWPTRPGWQATAHLYLWDRLLESNKES